MTKWFHFLSYIVLLGIGSIGALLFIYFKKKDLYGGWKMGIFVGVIGGILGGFIFNLFFVFPLFHRLQDIPYFKYLLVNPMDINMVTTALGTYVALLGYSYVSDHTERS